MNYANTLCAVDTSKALKLLQIDGSQHGAYIRYPCHKCGKQAVIKAYGEKKNLWYCPECKGSGHIISLVMAISQCDWDTAKKLLEEKACFTGGKITKQLTLTYELEFDKNLKQHGHIPGNLQMFGVGKAQGENHAVRHHLLYRHGRTKRR